MRAYDHEPAFNSFHIPVDAVMEPIRIQLESRLGVKCPDYADGENDSGKQSECQGDHRYPFDTIDGP